MSHKTMIDDFNPTPFNWFNYERRNWLAVCAVIGLFGFAMGNGHTTQSAITDISSNLGQKNAQLAHAQTNVVVVTKQRDAVIKAVKESGDEDDIPQAVLHPQKPKS